MAAKALLLAVALFCAASAAPEARQSRIVGGDSVNIQQFPYVVSLVYFYPGAGITIQRCVGSIVSSFHIVSSNSCFFRAILPNMTVRAGSSYSLAGGVVATIQKLNEHPDYVANPRANDIAVLQLASPLLISSSVNILYLPPQNNFIPDGTSFNVVSWGFESEGGNQLDSLQSIVLQKVTLDQCQAAFSGVDNVAIGDTVICAANPGKGTCFGDSGAPMALNNVLVGVASVYHECGTDTYPDVFTRVDRFTNWILEVARAPSAAGVPVRVTAV